MTAAGCPAWCTTVHSAPAPDDEYIQHSGKPIEWTTARQTDTNARLVWMEPLNEPAAGDSGPWVEFGGDCGGVYGPGSEVDLLDVQTVIDVLRELAGVSRRAVR